MAVQFRLGILSERWPGSCPGHRAGRGSLEVAPDISVAVFPLNRRGLFLSRRSASRGGDNLTRNGDIHRTPLNRSLEKKLSYETKRAITPGWSDGLHFVVDFGDTDSRVIYYLPTSRLFLTTASI